MAHFIPASIPVKAGETVKQGQVIGKCRNSGHSTEPHLYFHVQNHPCFYLGIGLPIKFSQLKIDGKTVKKAYIKKGQRVQSLVKN
ncbi:MAG: M23 family metallopeptidase [Halanaerobiaceae bacterium]